MTKHQQNLKPKTEATTLPAPLGAETLAQLDADVAALAAEARELTEDIRVGDDLKFKKGKWTKIIGDEETKIGPTTPFVVDMRSYKRGWIDGAIANQCASLSVGRSMASFHPRAIGSPTVTRADGRATQEGMLPTHGKKTF